jgi:hypothetical protein
MLLLLTSALPPLAPGVPDWWPLRPCSVSEHRRHCRVLLAMTSRGRFHSLRGAHALIGRPDAERRDDGRGRVLVLGYVAAVCVSFTSQAWSGDMSRHFSKQ